MSGGARRNLSKLFDEMSPPDAEAREIGENRENQLAETIQNQDAVEASARWSYDFVNDRPIAGGRWEWERVSHEASPLPPPPTPPPSEQQVAGEVDDDDDNDDATPRTPELGDRQDPDRDEEL